MWFSSWGGIGRIIVTTAMVYISLIVMLRISGKRTLSKMNAFDLVVTVALGSVLGTVMLSKDVPIVDGVTGLAMLIALQFIIAYASAHWQWASRWVKSDPRLLLYNGEILHQALLDERVAESEVRAAVRTAGLADPKDVAAVVLETDGTFSVISSADHQAVQSLKGVIGVQKARQG